MEEKNGDTANMDKWTLVTNQSNNSQSDDHSTIEDDVVVIGEDESDDKADPNLQEHNVSSSFKRPPEHDLNFSPPVYEEELCDDYYTSGVKVRSYIHKRNNKLSGTLNMILFGTIVTTVCLAVGHMWGTTDDCSPEMSSSLSELMFAMQELQHENYVLKTKIKLLESLENMPLADKLSDIPVMQSDVKNGDDFIIRDLAEVEERKCLCNDLAEKPDDTISINIVEEFVENGENDVPFGPQQNLTDTTVKSETLMDDNYLTAKKLIPNENRFDHFKVKRSASEDEFVNSKLHDTYSNDSLGKYNPKQRKQSQYKEPKKKFLKEKNDYHKIKYKDRSQKYQEKKKRYENFDYKALKKGNFENKDYYRQPQKRENVADKNAFNKNYNSNKQKFHYSQPENKPKKNKKFKSN